MEDDHVKDEPILTYEDLIEKIKNLEELSKEQLVGLANDVTMIEMQRTEINKLKWKVAAHEKFELKMRKATSVMISSIKELMALLVEV